MTKRIKLTPKNYKKNGYDNYYRIKREYKFTINNDYGGEDIYDSYGNYEGEMS